MNGDVLARLMELDDTLDRKLDKGLVEDADYYFEEQAWHKFDEFLHGDCIIFCPCCRGQEMFVEEKRSQCRSCEMFSGDDGERVV